ncbi:MAG: hypothetical protein FWE19_02995 [Oscillospiraceae bacterium]|nr:hypothetical protein [Oscillospiraceae bacterium]
MLQAYEGYLEENGQVHLIAPPVHLRGRRRVVVTVLDELRDERACTWDAHDEKAHAWNELDKNADTWDELDRIVSEMSEKPHLQDFPRTKLGRELIDFDEV